jgi:hypothetical protein
MYTLYWSNIPYARAKLRFWGAAPQLKPLPNRHNRHNRHWRPTKGITAAIINGTISRSQNAGQMRTFEKI